MKTKKDPIYSTRKIREELLAKSLGMRVRCSAIFHGTHGRLVICDRPDNHPDNHFSLEDLRR